MRLFNQSIICLFRSISLSPAGVHTLEGFEKTDADAVENLLQTTTACTQTYVRTCTNIHIDIYIYTCMRMHLATRYRRSGRWLHFSWFVLSSFSLSLALSVFLSLLSCSQLSLWANEGVLAIPVLRDEKIFFSSLSLSRLTSDVCKSNLHLRKTHRETERLKGINR